MSQSAVLCPSRHTKIVLLLLAVACGARTGLDWDDGASFPSTSDGGTSDSGSPFTDAGTPSSPTDAATNRDAAPTLDASACLAGGNIWHRDAWLNDPPVTLVVPPGGPIHADAQPMPPAQIWIAYDAPDQVNAFSLTIAGEADQQGTPVTPLHLGLYKGAERAGFQVRGFPGLDITQDGGGCNTLYGSFDVSALDVNAQFVEELTVAFELSCESLPVESGCLHVEHVPID